MQIVQVFLEFLANIHLPLYLSWIQFVRLSSAALDDFSEVVKLMHHIWLGDANHAWYSPYATHLICLYNLEHSLVIHSFRHICPCLTIEVPATQVKFHEPSVYCTVINCAFAFHITNVFGCFHGVMVQFELVKFPN